VTFEPGFTSRLAGINSVLGDPATQHLAAAIAQYCDGVGPEVL
jgi:hypothetical protein